MDTTSLKIRISTPNRTCWRKFKVIGADFIPTDEENMFKIDRIQIADQDIKVPESVDKDLTFVNYRLPRRIIIGCLEYVHQHDTIYYKGLH